MNDSTPKSSGRVLVHVCCATCYIGLAAEFRRLRLDFEGFFYNPNVHPLLEFRRRLKACKVLAQEPAYRMIFDENYGLNDWLRAVVGQEENRCEICYRMRLQRTAEVAKEKGFTGFTTTLLASPNQRHELIRTLGEEIAKSVGVEFVYGDWRVAHEAGRAEVKRRNLYRQQYCGCVYSECDRYRDTREELWRGGP